MPRNRRRREIAIAYAFLAPTLVCFLAFVLWPFVASTSLSFFQWDLFTSPTFVGTANFKDLFDDPLLLKTLGNTALFAAGAVSLNVGLGLLIAVGINRLRRRRFAAAIRSAYFLPFIMSSAVVAVLWGFLLHRDFGVVNWLLGEVGLGPVPWLPGRRRRYVLCR
jgi:multiple sugar transport system permease protein